jgi:hypothetical protein
MASQESGSIMDHVRDIHVRGGEDARPERRLTIVDCEDDSSSDSDSDDDFGCNYRHIREGVKTILIAVAIVLIIIIICCLGKGSRSIARLSDDLTSNGWILMTQEGCPHCEKQLEALGGSYPKIVRCSGTGTLIDSTVENIPFGCSDVPGFPYWYNDKTQAFRVGFQDLTGLKQMVSSS